ncbi:MAG: hypothetical protein ACPH5V_10135, partial [Alcanivorax sp.]
SMMFVRRFCYAWRPVWSIRLVLARKKKNGVIMGVTLGNKSDRRKNNKLTVFGVPNKRLEAPEKGYGVQCGFY